MIRLREQGEHENDCRQLRGGFSIYSLVLFDLDGTLLNTVPMITACFQQVFWEFGRRRISENEVHALFGPGESIIFRREFGDQWPEVLESYLKCYRQKQQNLRLDPAILTVIERLRSDGIKLGIVTNKERDTTTLTLEYLGVQEQFDLVVTAQDVPRPKPFPDGILMALERFGAGKHEAVLIGDTPNDIRAAQSAGIDIIHAAWYLSEKPDGTVEVPVVSSIEDLLPYLWDHGQPAAYTER